MTRMTRTELFLAIGLTLSAAACTASNPTQNKEKFPDESAKTPTAAATITKELVDLLTLPTPTRISVVTPTLRPIEAVPSPYAVATRASDDDRDLIDRQNNVIATLNGNRNLLSFMENGPLTETQLKALMEKNNIGLAFKNGVNNNPDKLFRMEKGELKEIPIPQLTPQLTPDDFWSDQDNPEYPHALVTEKPGTKTHVVFDGKNWVENIDGKSTGRVVFDMQKAAIGGVIPGAKETVVTVTPKPPLTEAPPKAVLGTVEIDGKKVDLDGALKYMQDKKNLPTWRQIDITMPDGSWQPASLLKLGKPTALNANELQFSLGSVEGANLTGTAFAGDWRNPTISTFLINQVNTNSWTAIKTGKDYEFRKLDPFISKNVVVIGVPMEAAQKGMRYTLIGVGLLKDLTTTP